MVGHVGKGIELEERIARMAEDRGWTVLKRKRFGHRVLDLVLQRGGVILVVQAKNKVVTSPSDVSQTRRDYVEYIDWLIEERLGLQIRPVLVSDGFSKATKRRARSYRIMCYKVEELGRLLR